MTGREPINLAELRRSTEACCRNKYLQPRFANDVLALIDAVEAATALLPIAEIFDSDLAEETSELTRLRETLARFT